MFFLLFVVANRPNDETVRRESAARVGQLVGQPKGQGEGQSLGHGLGHNLGQVRESRFGATAAQRNQRDKRSDSYAHCGTS